MFQKRPLTGDPPSAESGPAGDDVLPFRSEPVGGPPVSGFLHRPRGELADGLVLTHGAGSTATTPLLVAIAEALATDGLAVLRCDLPFRQARATGPPPREAGPRDREGLREAVRALRQLVPGRVFLGGHSYGGRQASMAAAEEPALAAGLLLLSYPLHPPRRPETPRTAHFPRLHTPALFVHGSRDPFGSLAEVRAALTLVPAPTTLLPIEGGTHALAPPGPAAARQVAQTVGAAFLALIR